ncbi:Trans-1,2-dihydrobenzene-1,2-diol dehydrogenase [Camponotus floridanus]|uniref:Trans-1,2-dihydrobenzene-1,2-diol dehydrogenase n=1 Tax=Camponotus floridanus TaxID=104421 RepID=E2AXQ4_CAMFO|nr:trans-1,2-dihydrobenzene-1,2-diol dehydrogenase isoform X2 [Camponotus floridanus]XP_011265919.1 trans-1,2-dihydrobenzene-1,2-diol dehydrogenase isoform X2 [Camponotus floridanus]XP_019884897.1 trans-1,2-dihydrobenzene-1,2-diol dehydrogenase isoform X2 [Camponotus floridanus]EFN61800.1 Trans-1,2-dihydrobenzene-1,2-diol dehydrogenase [Camponotus floridanus]
MMATLRWGIASAGKISHDFVSALHTLPANEHKLIAVAAQQLSRAQDFANLHNIPKAFDDYEKLALDKDIDIVYIGTIHPQHFDIGMMMLKHGKHILCEKPLTMNLKQTTELINYARSKKLFLMEAVWSRCFPVYDAIRKELASGNIGDIHQVTASFGFGLSNVYRVVKKELGGGTILDLGIYCLQFVCLVYNNEMPESIKASGVLNEDGVDISMSATLLYKGNRTATITTQGFVNLTNDASICGTKGIIKVPNFWCPTTVELPSGTLNFPLPQLNHKINFINSAGLSYEAAEARACILKGLIESPKITHDTSLLLARLEDEIRKQLGVVYSQDA